MFIRACRCAVEQPISQLINVFLKFVERSLNCTITSLLVFSSTVNFKMSFNIQTSEQNLMTIDGACLSTEKNAMHLRNLPRS